MSQTAHMPTEKIQKSKLKHPFSEQTTAIGI